MERKPPSQAFLKLLRFHFAPDRLRGDSLLQDHSPGTLSGGGGLACVQLSKRLQKEAQARLHEPASGCAAHAERLKPISVMASGNCIRISYLLRSVH